MHKNSQEEGITNFGIIPPSIPFSEAIKSIKEKRKFFIDPYKGGHRLTICDTLRMTYRELDKLPDSKEKTQAKEYIEQAFDFGKRMDARMKELKNILDNNKIEYSKNPNLKG